MYKAGHIGHSICWVFTELNPAPCDTAYASFDAKGLNWAVTVISYKKGI